MENILRLFKTVFLKTGKTAARAALIAVTCSLLISRAHLQGDSGFWSNNSTSNWDNSTNWFAGGTFPNGAGEGAAFFILPEMGTVISSSIDITIGQLSILSGLNPIGFDFGANRIIFDNGSDFSAFFFGGTVSVENDVLLNSDLEIFGTSGNTLTFNGSFTGNQNIAINANGAIVNFNPTAGNTYGGSTTINRGRLVLNAAQSLPGGVVILDTSLASLLFNQNNAIGSTASILCSQGAVRFANVAETLFQVTINQRGLFLENDAASNSILTLNGLIPIVIGGDSRIALSGLNLSAAGAAINYNSTFRGRAFINGSLLPNQLTNISINGLATFNIPSGNNSDKDLVLSNVNISGGSLRKIGNGILAFENPAPVTSSTIPAFNIEEGTVSIGTAETTALLQGTFINVNGGLLNGFGTFLGSVNNNSGTVNPGDNSPSTSDAFAFNNYTQAANGTLLIKVIDGANDKLNVANQVTLNGTLILSAFSANNGDEIVIIDNSASILPISGTFSNFEAHLPVGLQASIIYNQQTVVVQFSAICADCPICPICPDCPESPLKGPSHLLGKRLHNYCEKEFINFLSWQPSPSDHIAAYRIYRNGKRIGRVGALAALSFKDKKIKPNKCYRYAVTAVTEDGVESKATKLTFPKCQKKSSPAKLEKIDLIEGMAERSKKMKKEQTLPPSKKIKNKNLGPLTPK